MGVAGLLIVSVAVAVVVVGSYRNLIATAITIGAGCFAVAMAVGLICEALQIPRQEWQAPILLFGMLPVLGVLASISGQRCDPIGANDVRRVAGQVLAARQRQAAIRADVRRRVNSYKVEVS